MLDRAEVFEVLASHFPDSDMATGLECAASLISMFNGIMAQRDSIRAASPEAMESVADLITNQQRDSKIMDIRDFRFAFPNEGLKEAKDAIEASYRRNGKDNSGRNPSDAALAELRAKLTGDPWRQPTADELHTMEMESDSSYSQSDEPPF